MPTQYTIIFDNEISTLLITREWRLPAFNDEFDGPVADARKQAKRAELKKAGIDNIF
jgi:hypothetical protein